MGNLKEVLGRSLKKMKPPEKIGSLEWGLKYRWMSSEQTKLAGKYSDKLTPWAKFILAAMDDPKVRRVVVVKSAQIGWTDGIWNTFLGRIIHTAPCNIFMLFAKRDAYDKYIDKKFNPSVRATPALRELINVDAVRSAGSRAGFKKFPGGSLTLEGANSPSNIKSDTVNIGCVEEPDDCSSNVKGQGDSVAMLEERLKLDPDSKLVFGGTPTIKDLSRVELAYQQTDQRKFMVPCHDCGEGHVLDWANVFWQENQSSLDEIYGHAQPETAAYACPCCGSVWDDRQKSINVQKLYEVITKPEIVDDVGFYINELYSLFSGSELSTLVKKYLKAKFALSQGNDSLMISFVNNTLAQGYEYKTDNASESEINELALEYKEFIVPRGGVVLTAGIDVQRDRVAIVIRAWGKGMESWLVYWGEVWAKNSINDVNDPVWDELDRILFGAFQHESGAILRIKAASLDTSDGVTQDATYHYVRSRAKRSSSMKLMAIKGAKSEDAPVVSLPRKIDINNLKTRADKFGLELWRVGTQNIKDRLSGNLKLTGFGPWRMHHYKGVRDDYAAQMSGEIKAPRRGKLVWQQKSGVSIEAWDCECYAFHAAHVERLHVKKDDWWESKALSLMQVDLLSSHSADDLVVGVDNRPDVEDGVESDAESDAEPSAVDKPKPVKKKRQRRQSSNSWLNG